MSKKREWILIKVDFSAPSVMEIQFKGSFAAETDAHLFLNYVTGISALLSRISRLTKHLVNLTAQVKDYLLMPVGQDKKESSGIQVFCKQGLTPYMLFSKYY